MKTPTLITLSRNAWSTLKYQARHARRERLAQKRQADLAQVCKETVARGKQAQSEVVRAREGVTP